jgi:hypothetical protein
MFRHWMLWTLLLALTCGMIAGCAPEGGTPGGTVTEEGKK